MLLTAGTNLFTSTNNSYTPHCYKSKITNPLVRWKTKTRHEILGRWYTSIPPFQWTLGRKTRSISKYHLSLQSQLQDSLVLLKQNMSENNTTQACWFVRQSDLNIETVNVWSVGLTVWWVKVCGFSPILLLSWQVWT